METTSRDDCDRVGPYRIHDRIGAGGYAEVFSGVDTRNGLRVALKRLRLKHLDDPDSRERFHREGLALEAIDHPNIVRCFGILFQEDDVWIVMELLKGFSLRQVLREKGCVSVERALLIAIDVADGLADMHEMAIVHRDLKPENIFLSMPGLSVKVVDLGVAKFHGWSVPTTDPGLLVCTPSYAAPEITFGYSVDARSDIYALGLVLYEMLVGKNPFANGDGTLPQGQDALTAHIVRTPPTVSVRRPDVPEPVASLIARMMDKDPTGRPPAMKVVARELRRALRTLRQPLGEHVTPAAKTPRSGAPESGRRAAMTSALIHRPGPLFLLPPVGTEPEAGPPPIRLDRPMRPTFSAEATTPAPSERPGKRARAALMLLVMGTMLIGGACGSVIGMRVRDLPQVPGTLALYAMIFAGALSGTAGAVLVQARPARFRAAGAARPSVWILAIGIAAGLLLGAVATWLLVSPLPLPSQAGASSSPRPS